MRITILVVFVLAGPLPSQQKQTQTWGGLKFGMTVSEARKALPRRTNTAKKSDQVPGKSVPGIMRLRIVKGVLGALPVTGGIYFEEKDEGLTGVLLISDHESPNYCEMPGNLERQAASLLWESFLGELRKQNGDPRSSRTAEGEDGGVTTRIASWDGSPDSPDITLLLMGSCKRINVTVTYTPVGFRKR